MRTPILLIIEREFMSRVRKKTFLLMTLLAPVLLASLMILPGVLASMPQEDKSLIVLDEPSMLLPEKGTSQFSLDYLDPREFDLELAKTFLKSSNHDALLHIPTGEGWDPDFIKNNIKANFNDNDYTLPYDAATNPIFNADDIFYYQLQKTGDLDVDTQALADTLMEKMQWIFACNLIGGVLFLAQFSFSMSYLCHVYYGPQGAAI